MKILLLIGILFLLFKNKTEGLGVGGAIVAGVSRLFGSSSHS